jgi:large subunit ribosomal protein L35
VESDQKYLKITICIGGEMPKLKTKRSAAKRYKITGTGKIVGKHSGKSHFMRRKSAGRRRKLSQEIVLTSADIKKIKTLLPYGV